MTDVAAAAGIKKADIEAMASVFEHDDLREALALTSRRLVHSSA